MLQQALLRSESNSDISKMKNQSMKKSLEKSNNVLEEKRKTVKRNYCMKKTNTFTIIALNIVQDQLLNFWDLQAVDILIAALRVSN